jgi:hypothetical protein
MDDETVPIAQLVSHIHIAHTWSRPQIAHWLTQFEPNDPEPQLEQPQPVPSEQAVAHAWIIP